MPYSFTCAHDECVLKCAELAYINNLKQYTKAGHDE